MTRRSLSVLALLPAAALALSACSSSTSGSGSTGTTGSTGSTSGSASTDSSSAPGGGTGSSSSSSSSGGGGGAGTAPTDAAGLGKLLQSGVAGVTSAHIALTVDAASEKITGSGDEQLSAGKVTALRISETVPGAGDIEIIITGGKDYAKLPGTLNPSGKPYVLLSETSSNATVKALASSLDSSLNSASIGQATLFADAASSVKLHGMTSVDGTSALHYSVVVDPAKLPADYPGKSALAAAGLTSIPVELYVDSQGRPIEITENIAVSGQKVSTVVTVSKYNQPVQISAPPASEVGTS